MPTRRSIEALSRRARRLLASALLTGFLLTATAAAAAVSIPDRPTETAPKAATPELPRLPSEPSVTPPDLPPPPDPPDPPPPPERPPPPAPPSKPTLPSSPPRTPAAGATEKAPAGGARAPGGEAGGGAGAARPPRLPVGAPRASDGARSTGDGATGDARSVTGGSQSLPGGRGRAGAPAGANNTASTRAPGGGSPTPDALASGPSGRELRQGTVGAAEPAPLQRLIARVWPAFALAPAESVVALLEGRLGAAIARLPVASELLRQVAPQLALASARGGVGNGGQPAAQVSPSRPATDSLTGWITDENRLPLLVAVALCGALILFLVAAVRRDLREMSRYRWRH